MKTRSRFSAFLLLFCLIPAAIAQTVTAHVVRVIDGDTIVVTIPGARTAVHVRFAEIDAPEHDQPWGAEATAFTATQIGRGPVVLTITGIDRYGRTIAHIQTPDGSDLNTELVRAGLAWWYRRYSNDSRLAALQERARRTRRGAWADSAPIAPWDWRHMETLHP